ncbi:MAG: alpha/beta hydrolase [Acidimicrobiia bacterium]
MRSLLRVIHLWFRVSVAVVRRVIRRLLLGPTLPSWMWRTDIVAAVARAAIDYAATVPDDRLINQFGLRVRAPVPWALRNKVRVRRRTLAGRDVDRYVRVDTTPDAATILYFHGGGYVFGNPGTHRQHLARLVHATRTTAYAPRYRLAPRHPFPAALDDARDEYRALLEAGTDPADVIVAGDSAGGGLAVALLMSLRDGGEPLPCGSILFSPYTDLEHRGHTIVTNADTDYLPIDELSGPNRYYASAEQLRDPLVSPIHADLHSLPRMLIFAGGAEMLLEDSVQLHAHAQRDGVDSTLVIEPEMIHVWPALAPWEPASRRALEAAAGWLAAGG